MGSILQVGLDESARGSASFARGTLQEHRATQDSNVRGESKGLTYAAECLWQGQAQQEVAFLILVMEHLLKQMSKGKVCVSLDSTS
jgi:hypothetical protein